MWYVIDGQSYNILHLVVRVAAFCLLEDLDTLKRSSLPEVQTNISCLIIIILESMFSNYQPSTLTLPGMINHDGSDAF